MNCNLTRPEKYAKLIADARWASTFWHDMYKSDGDAKMLLESVRYHIIEMRLGMRRRREGVI